MSVETIQERESLRAAGRVVKRTLDEMEKAVRVGVTTLELDQVAARVLSNAGARSGPQLDYDFPGTTCISVNEEAIHGIPGARVLKEGDLVKLDVTAELNGFYADACRTVSVGQASVQHRKVIATAQAALQAGIEAAVENSPLNQIGAAIEGVVKANGMSVCESLIGHGIGRRIHEPPNVPNKYMRWMNQPLSRGLVITIEPVIALGNGGVTEADDGWTIVTRDGSVSAHAEHTIIVNGSTPEVLTI